MRPGLVDYAARTSRGFLDQEQVEVGQSVVVVGFRSN
jgi:hypothetical protein